MTEFNFSYIINLLNKISSNNTFFFTLDKYPNIDILTEFQLNDSACTFGSV